MHRVVFALVAVVGALLIGGLLLLGRGGNEPAKEALEGADPLYEAHVVIGDPEAPGWVVEFSNYACPHCRNHALEVLPLIIRDYVDTGKVRYVFRTFPFPGQEDVYLASVAAGCAYDLRKERFLDYHQLLFRAVMDWSGRPAAEVRPKLVDYARQLGYPAGEFEACLDSEAVRKRVDLDVKLAEALGVTGTPTFFVNGEKLVGFMPYEKWREVLR